MAEPIHLFLLYADIWSEDDFIKGEYENFSLSVHGFYIYTSNNYSLLYQIQSLSEQKY